MFKSKTKKSASKILCTLLALMILMYNGQISYTAYAATPQVPADEKCPGDWLDADGSVKGSKCYKNEETSCHKGYTKLDSASVAAADADADHPVKTTCSRTPTGSSSGTTNLIANVEVLVGLQAFLNRLIWPVLVLIGGLMETDLLFGSGMEERLREIWIPIRNLVNILFVIVLVGLALYNVLGLGEEGGNASLKKALPKIVIGIIAVNFSFIGIKVILDATNQLTTSIFALPGQVSEGLDQVVGDPPDDDMVKRLCASMDGVPFGEFDDEADEVIKQRQEFTIYQNAIEKFNKGVTGVNIVTIEGASTALQLKQKFEAKHAPGSAFHKSFDKLIQAAKNKPLCTGKGLTEQGKIFLKKYGSRNAAFALALNMGKIVFYQDVSFNGLKSVEKLFVNTLFSLLLYLVFVASFLALFVVLLGRLVVMWLCVAISPVLLLVIAEPSLKEKAGGFGKISEAFVKNAIAPIIIALAMTIGWIMLKAIQGLSPDPFSDSALTVDPSNGVPVAGLNTLQDFVVAIGVIAVVWLGVFSAAEGTVAQFATDWLKQHLESAGKWVGSLPFKHAPIIPISLPDHPHQSYTFSQLGRYMDRLTDSHDNELVDNAKLDRGATADNVKDIHSMPGILHHMFKATDLETKAQRDALKTWISKNPTAFSAIERKDSGLARQMRNLAKADDDEAKTIVAEIKKNPLVKAATTPDGATPGAPAGTETPQAGTSPAAAKQLGPETQVGGKPLSEVLARPAAPGSTPTPPTPAEFTTLNTNKTKLDAAIKTNDSTKITSALTTLAKPFKDANNPLTTDSLKELIGETQVDNILATLGEGSAAIEALDNILNPPPAGPPAPTTGSGS